MAHSTHFDTDSLALDASATRATTLAAATPKTLIARLRHALAVRRERRALSGLCARMRDDIGLSQADVYREATRAFLDVPAATTPSKLNRR
jgi:uncharacterized protein YjiS (DUF1127 family)